MQEAAPGDATLASALRSELPRTQAASRAARGSDPESIQALYNAARDLEERLRSVGAVSEGCRPLLWASTRYARAEIMQAEAIDRRSDALRRLGLRNAASAAAELERLPRRCSAGRVVKVEPARELGTPRSGEAFFGEVRARAPAGAQGAQLVVDGRVVGVLPIRSGFATGLLRALPGRYDLRVRFSGERPLESARAPDVWLLPRTGRNRVADAGRQAAVDARLAALADGFDGHSGIWIQSLTTGRAAGWNSDARFPAASTVKLAVLVAALGRFGARPEASSVAYDLRALTAWSSNLATNRLVHELGGSEAAGARIAQETLGRLGARSSTYTGDYRVGTSVRAGDSTLDAPDPPPLVSQRTTTAHDLGRVLYALHAAAMGDRRSLDRARLTRHQARVGLAFLLSSEPVGENLGLFRPWLGSAVPLAQKNGWLRDARHTAGIVYAADGPRIAVLLTYKAGLTRSHAAALGRKVVRLALEKQ